MMTAPAALDALKKASRAFARTRSALNDEHRDQAALDRKQAAHQSAQLALITAAVTFANQEKESL